MQNHSEVNFIRLISLHGTVSHLFHCFWEFGDIAERSSLEDIPILVVRTPLSNTSLPFPLITKFESFWVTAATTTETWAPRANGKLDVLSRHPLALYILSLRLHTKGKHKLYLTFSLLRICYNRNSLFSWDKNTPKDILWNLTPRESSSWKQILFISFYEITM